MKLKSRRDELRSCRARVLYLGYEVSRDSHRPGTLVLHRLERALARLRDPKMRRPRELECLERTLQSYRAILTF